MRVSGAAAVALLLTACTSTPQPDKPSAPDDFILPLTHDAVWPMFDLVVEGVAVTAIFDSGANRYLLWDSAPEVLENLRLAEEREIGGLGGDGSVNGQAIEQVKISFPTLATNPGTLTLPWAVTGLPEATHGIFDLIAPLMTHGGPPNVTVVDHNKGVVEVYFDPARAPDFEDAFRLPLFGCDNGEALLCANFSFETESGIPMSLPLTIDTGASGSVDIITDQWPEDVTLGPFDTSGAGVAGTFESALGPDLYWLVDGERVGPIASSTEERGTTDESTAGRVGSEFLRQTRYAIDRFNMELIVDRAAAQPGALTTVARFVRVLSLGDWSGYLVVAPDDLAEIGLAEGDIIRSIDGRAISPAYSYSAIRTLRTPGETELCWERPSTSETGLCAVFNAPG